MNEQEQYDWMVYVSCMTFNHAPYIVDAMNGFTMQETNFLFVCAIVDDASTDGEQEVIKRYLNENFDLEDKKVARHEETDDYVLTFARHKTNINCHFAVFYLKYNHYSIKKPKGPYLAQWRDNAKYIAMCEGDDYWIVNDKLQKQVDFLEQHSDYSMCFHRAIESYDDNREDKLFSEIDDRDYTDTEIFSKFIVPTGSVVYKSVVNKSSLLVQFRKDRRINVGDIPLWLSCCREGNIRGFSNVMSVYRRHFGSWTSMDKGAKAIMKGAYRQEAIMEIYGHRLKKIGRQKFATFAMNSFIQSVNEGNPYYMFFLRSLKKYPKEMTYFIIRVIAKSIKNKYFK